jgi:hypothetical protein
MLVNDLITLETYFGREAAVKSLDDLIIAFGAEEVGRAVTNHYIELRPVPCRIYACLTETARMQFLSH